MDAAGNRLYCLCRPYRLYRLKHLHQLYRLHSHMRALALLQWQLKRRSAGGRSYLCMEPMLEPKHKRRNQCPPILGDVVQGVSVQRDDAQQPEKQQQQQQDCPQGLWLLYTSTAGVELQLLASS